MKISIKGFIYHKTSERFVDCFDRFGVNIENNKFAVSDGVSKSFFSGIWAELLVDSFVNTRGKINLSDTAILTSIQNQWLSSIEKIVSRPNQKFFVRNLYNQGKSAAATFVGLHFLTTASKYKWEAFAIGDSFLFFVPERVKDISKNFKEVIYLSSKKDFEFDNFPDFFDSRSKVNKGKIKQTERELISGTFYIMTDALSQWFINEKQAAVDEIASWINQNTFEKRIQQLRKGILQNDDVALLIIKVRDGEEKTLTYTEVDLTDFQELLEAEKSQQEKEEAKWASIEKGLQEKFEIEKQYAEKKLSEKHRDERENYFNNLIEYIQRQKQDAKRNLLKKHAEELERFELEWKRIEHEREGELAKKQESERVKLEQELRSRFEALKQERRKILLQENEASHESREKITSSTDSSTNTINETHLNKEESNKKEDIKKRKGFWESTKEISKEIGTGAIDAVSNLFHNKNLEEDESQGEITKEKYRREIKINSAEDEAEKEKKKDEKDGGKDKDISSITEKF